MNDGNNRLIKIKNECKKSQKHANSGWKVAIRTDNLCYGMLLLEPLKFVEGLTCKYIFSTVSPLGVSEIKI